MWMPRRFLAGLAVLPLCALAVPGRAAETDKFVPNNADAVIIVNVRQITESTLFKNYENQIKELIKNNADAKKTLQDLGLDPFKDVYTIVMAGPGGKQDESFVIVEGRFDRTKLEARAEAAAKEPKEGVKIIKEGNYKIYEIENKDGGGHHAYGAILSNSILVFGQKKDMVVDALDKQAGKKKSELKKEVAALLAKVDSKKSIALVALPSGLGNQPAQEFADKIKNITGGLTVSDAVKADFILAAKDEKGAKALAESLEDGLGQVKGLVALMANQQKELAPVIDVIGTIKIDPSGSNVNLKAEVSKDVIAKLEKAAQKKIKEKQQQ
jgi:hypothetical protein